MEENWLYVTHTTHSDSEDHNRGVRLSFMSMQEKLQILYIQTFLTGQLREADREVEYSMSSLLTLGQDEQEGRKVPPGLWA